MKASELLQAQHDANTVSIALNSVSHFFQAFNLQMPRQDLAAMERLKTFLETLLESEVSLKIEEDE